MATSQHEKVFKAIEKAVDFAIKEVGGIAELKKLSMFPSANKKKD